MIRRLKFCAIGFFAAAAVSLALGAPARATVTVVQDPGALQYTSSVEGFGRSVGSDMVGMTVAVQFGDGSTHTGVWAAAGGQAGQAAVAGLFSLSVAGNTWDNAWSFSNLSDQAVKRVVIDAGVGNAVFDVDFGNADGTAGSFAGRTFDVVGGVPFDIVATYRDEVALNGQPVVGDVFRVLDLVFAGEVGMAGNTAFSFRADTDNAPNGLTAVSEPGAAAAFGLGILVLAAARRRL